jgi:flagellar biosynthesis component FlhA
MIQFEKIYTEFQQKKSEFEKDVKVESMTRNSIETWLEQIAKELGMTYSMIKKETSTTLILKLVKTQLEINVPHKKFMEIMPTLTDIIQTYRELQEQSAAKILISNYSTNARIRWKIPEPKKED